MSKFEPIKVDIDGEVYELSCTGYNLAKLEKIYNKPFVEAVAELVDALQGKNFSILYLYKAFCTLCKGAEPDENHFLESIKTTKDTVAIAEAIAAAIMSHFPDLEDDEVHEKKDEGPVKA